jgi:hypothetical protein
LGVIRIAFEVVICHHPFWTIALGLEAKTVIEQGFVDFDSFLTIQ